jgi:phosphomethylpyrimidine synthase
MLEKNVVIKNDPHHIAKLKSKNGYLEAGYGRKTLINTLLGFNDKSQLDLELQKLDAINRLENKPEIITDLSTAKTKRCDTLWYNVIEETSLVAGTVPIYLAAGNGSAIDENELMDIIIEQMEYGVGVITIHPTATREIFLESKNKMVPVTSRGGGIVVKDLIAKSFSEENVYIKLLPQIITYARKYHVTLSLGATFRSANIFDSYDKAQRMEIDLQISLAEQIARQDVSVVIESPGHARPKDIRMISSILRKAGYPVMPLGPIPTDAAVGMDHVSSAIGASLMGLEGCAQILAAVTREEHTGGVPSVDTILESIHTAQIAAHIIDIHNLDDTESDMEIVRSRSNSNTCIAGKEAEYCDRCRDMCPLMIQ